VHRSCGGTPVPVSTIYSAMNVNDLAIVSLLADSGNGEVQNPITDLPLINGQDEPNSTATRIVHWDAEWHWDATYTQFPHQALGGHVLTLGITNASQVWEEYTYPIFKMARDQGGVAGFAHMQYLGDTFPTTLNCCLPIEYPVEVALGSADFISEDVAGSDTAMRAYYRLLNCGFRPGFAAGSDYPCNANIGDLLTYVKVNGNLTYRKYIDGIKAGRTVVSRNGHKEFLDLKANASAVPGDEISLASPASVPVSVVWTANQNFTGTLELVQNGTVVASQNATVTSSAPVTLNANLNFSRSGWVVARRMSSRGHEVHTGAIFVKVASAPIRRSVQDAQFFVDWMDQLLLRTAPEGVWASYYENSRSQVHARIQSARTVYQQIAAEAAAQSLEITTSSLPEGAVGSQFSTTLTGTGGTGPYVWAVTPGTLPSGLTLNSSSGTISGTPTAAGTSTVTINLSDSSNPVQSVSKSFDLTVSTAPALSYSLWTPSATPAVLDSGPDNSVELGVRFRSDVSGTIRGIRFYKSSANAGTHTGTLWTSTGTQLATGTFINETTSGWQQLNFATPVPISANTVYVASYHASSGHYSHDVNYFVAQFDSGPLHALADSNGGNGLYRYASSTVFPNKRWMAVNYWVDVVFVPNATATLSSIIVTPANMTVSPGATQQYTATGNYSDGSTQNLTAQVTWASSEPGVAQINAAGLATATAPGSSTITATLGNISSGTTFTVHAAPLAITTSTLAAGNVGAPYSATLSASGGQPPYTWSISAGSLPSGLSLNPVSGLISGTPAAAGTFNFTARVTDSSAPSESVTKALSLQVTQQAINLWSATTVPTVLDSGPDNSVELGVRFRSDVAGTIRGIRFYKSSGNTGTHTGTLWTSTGTQLATGTFINETPSGWQQLNFTTPVQISANTVYVASYHAVTGHYSQDVNYFVSQYDSGLLHALADSNGGNGLYRYGSSTVFPNLRFRAANYWVDVVFVPNTPATLNSITVTPANVTVAPGATQQYTATGNYSDGSTQNLTTQVAWSSSQTSVAQINPSGLATGNAPGSTTITATLSGASGNAALQVQAPPLSIVTTILPSGPMETPYSVHLSGTGGTLTYNWSLESGSLPAGLGVNPGSGVISGTPSTVGVYNFTIRLTDSGEPVQSVTKSLAITITATLNSITVTPAVPVIAVGALVEFTATGVYSDETTQDLTDQVVWVSSTPAVAQINVAGSATGVSSGSSTISAEFGGKTGNATLTVQPAALQITTVSLSNAVQNLSYSATLAGIGGATPYSWSITAGSLPVGLTLNPDTGVISGTPTTIESSSFTVLVADSQNPSASAIKTLSIDVSGGQPFSIWPASLVPTGSSSGPDSSVELGVRFRSDVDGIITGIRYYKLSANTGTHTGSLWTDNGALLATATFVNETASGWQQIIFAKPVRITANAVYVASYHTRNGYYFSAANYFTNPVDNPPIHAFADSSGGNGVYRYASGTVFPNLRWMASNYWVDVLFLPETAIDNISPTVTSIFPASGANAAPLNTEIKVFFSEDLDPLTVNTTTVTIRNSENLVVPAAVSYNASNNVATLVPSASLSAASIYTVTVKSGSSGISDSIGNYLEADYVSNFRTYSPNPYAGRPSGSILIITNASNPFSMYYAEILLAEGLNQFSLRDLSAISSSVLDDYDLVILGQTPLTSGQSSTLADWVADGGNLIAMRPDKRLSSLLGLLDAGTTLAEGYLLVNTSSGPGKGIVNQTMQFHGTADGYIQGTASTIATLYTSALSATANPAVTLRSVGSNGGQAAAFTYDLARSVVYTRQGNPAWAGQERDGLTPQRSNDLFYGPAVNNPQPNYVDFNKIAIPQADEQQRLLANMIISMVSDKQLLPRFWYFPEGHKAVVVMTGDDHALNGTSGRFSQYLGFTDPSAEVDKWETIRGTSYIFPNTPISDSQAASYNALGFEIGLHLNTGCANYTPAALNNYFTQQLAQFKAAFPSLPNPTTHRFHCVAWSGYSTPAEIGLNYGIRLETSYYYWPSNWVGNLPGVFTGSAMPMRFATTNGNVIDVYQAATQMTDESSQAYPFTANALLDRAIGSEGYYGAYVANMHTDVNPFPQSDAIIASASNRGVPVITARQLLNWTDARNLSFIRSVVWNDNSETFVIESNSGARGLQVMVPVPSGLSVSSVLYDGGEITFDTVLVKGISYAIFDGKSGAYQVNFEP
jgi:hypothetical protein